MLVADALVIVHLGFILFVVLGGLLVWRWLRLAWLHLPALAWGALLEFNGWICPLTPWEQHLRYLAGEAGYRGSFIEHYLLPVIYPPGLTRTHQVWLGVAIIIINLSIYAWLIARKRRKLKQ